MPFAAYRSMCRYNIKRIIRKSVRARVPQNYLSGLFMGKIPSMHSFHPRAAVRCMVTLGFSRFWAVRFPKKNTSVSCDHSFMSQAKTNIKFLETPQDSHIVDPNKEESDQTAQMRLLICVFVVRSTCVRNIYTCGMTHLRSLDTP